MPIHLFKHLLRAVLELQVVMATYKEIDDGLWDIYTTLYNKVLESRQTIDQTCWTQMTNASYQDVIEQDALLTRATNCN